MREIIISVLGAISAVIVTIIGAILSNRSSNMLQLRKLKEEHYISYIEALHNLAANNSNKDAISKYTYHRDKLLIVGSEDVFKNQSALIPLLLISKSNPLTLGFDLVLGVRRS